MITADSRTKTVLDEPQIHADYAFEMKIRI